MKSLIHGEKDFNILMVRSEIDDSVLVPNEYRLYGHLARRAGAHGAWPSVASMAQHCMISKESVRLCLRRLLDLNMIKARVRHGFTTVYTLTPLSQWKPEVWGTLGEQPHRNNRFRTNYSGRSLCHGENAFNILFIRAELDDYGLIPTEFRVYAHLARRAGTDGAWPTIASIAKTCRICPNTVRHCLRRLRELNLVKARFRSGMSTLYVLTSYSEWKPIPEKKNPYQNKGAPLSWEGTPTNMKEGGPPNIREGKESQEGYPLKDNTVEGCHRAQPPISPSSCPIPNGRGPDGLPAMKAQQTQERTCKRPQTPIHRKAYAIAERLKPHHWDNCKVTFGKEGARAYAEQALMDGHDELFILASYLEALAYCHGLATDQICDGKLGRHEKVNPALTIYLARKRLEYDGKTASERWDATKQRLNRERQEIEKLSADASDWFAQQHAAMTQSAESSTNTSAATTQPQPSVTLPHPAQGDGTAAERSEIGPASQTLSGRSVNRPVVVAPLSSREIGIPAGTAIAVPTGMPIPRRDRFQPGHEPLPVSRPANPLSHPCGFSCGLGLHSAEVVRPEGFQPSTSLCPRPHQNPPLTPGRVIPVLDLHRDTGITPPVNHPTPEPSHE